MIKDKSKKTKVKRQKAKGKRLRGRDKKIVEVALFPDYKGKTDLYGPLPGRGRDG